MSCIHHRIAFHNKIAVNLVMEVRFPAVIR